MVEIAEKYLDELKIANTQYVITKHIDKSHQHLHILANLVNNDGANINDNWTGLRSKKTAEKLTQEYQLITVQKKNIGLTNVNNLNEREKIKYKIYEAITNNLPQSATLNHLEKQLAKHGVETVYKYKGQTEELQGISFSLGKFKYKGSEIDRSFSLKNLQKTIANKQLKTEKKSTIPAIFTPHKSMEMQHKEMMQKE